MSVIGATNSTPSRTRSAMLPFHFTLKVHYNPRVGLGKNNWDNSSDNCSVLFMGNPFSSDEVWVQVGKICSMSRAMTKSDNLRKLLRHLIGLTLEGAGPGQFKGEVLSREVFGKTSSLGKREAQKLRDALNQYYQLPGRFDKVLIEMQTGSYGLIIRPMPISSPLGDRAAQHLFSANAAIDKRTLPGFMLAFRYLDRALRLHPNHPQLLATKALAHATRALHGVYPRNELEKAESLVKLVQAQHVDIWECSFANACVAASLYWDWPRAEAAFLRANAISYGRAQYHAWYTAFLACQGRVDDGVSLLRYSVEHGAPVVTWADLAINQLFAGQLEHAEQTINSAIDIFPKAHYLPYLHRALLYEAKGTPLRALKALNDVPLRWPASTITLGLRALLAGLAGESRKANWHFHKLRMARRIGRQYIPAAQLGLAAIGTGNYDEAATWFKEAALVERDPNMMLANVYPFLRHVRRHPEFHSLICDTMKLRFSQPMTPALARP